MPPVNDPTKLNVVKVVTTMDDAAADLQTSLRATIVATDEIFDISFIRQADGNGVVIVYTYEDVSP